MTIADKIADEMPQEEHAEKTSPRPQYGHVTDVGPWARAREIKTAELCDRLGIEHDEKFAKCPGCGEDGALIALDRKTGLTCRHNRCSNIGKPAGYRSNVDLVMEKLGLDDKVEAVNLIAEWFGFEGVRPKKASGEQPTQPDAANEPLGGFKLIGVEVIFAPLPPADELVPGVFRRGSVNLSGGFGGGTKTWSAIDLLIAVALGGKWLDRFACKQGRGTYLDWENGEYEMRRRIQKAVAGRGIHDAVTGLDFCSRPSGYLGTLDFEQRLTGLAAERDLIIVDTLRPASPPEIAENDSAIRGGLDQCHRVAENTGCTFVVLVHAKKTSGSPVKIDPREVLRGSSAIYDAADSVLVSTYRKGEPIHVDQVKNRFGTEIDPFDLIIEDTLLKTGIVLRGIDRDQPDRDTADEKFGSLREGVFHTIRTNPGASLKKLRVLCKGRGVDIDAALEDLIEAGRVHAGPGRNGGSAYRVKGSESPPNKREE